MVDTKGSIFSRIYLSLLLGYIVYFYSEIGFWADPRKLSGLIETVIFYSFVSYLYLWMVSYFGISNRLNVFLAGSVFGWIVEGIIVYEVYGALPFSIVWPPMAWHALITILVGVYSYEYVIRSSALNVAIWSSVIGLFYGFWSTFWWHAAEETFVLLPSEFTIFIFEISLPLILAYYLFSRQDKSFTPHKLEGGIVLALFLIAYIVANIVLFGLPLILLLLIPPVLWLLRRSGSQSYYEKFDTSIPLLNFLMLILIPVTASFYYFFAFNTYRSAVDLEVNIIVAMITVLISIYLFLESLYKILWKTNNP